MAPNDMLFAPSFMKIHQLAQVLLRGQADGHNDSIRLCFLLK